MDNTKPKLARCAVYTRKSTEHNLSCRCSTLSEACEAYIRSQAGEGWRLLGDRYKDGGFSGPRSTVRPSGAPCRGAARKVDGGGLQGRPPHAFAGGLAKLIECSMPSSRSCR
jgi:hypothetical protein